MRFKKSPHLPGAGRTKVWHHHGSDTSTAPRAIFVLKSAKGPNIFWGSVQDEPAQIPLFTVGHANCLSSVANARGAPSRGAGIKFICARTTRIYLDGRVLGLIIKPRPGFVYFIYIYL